MKTNNSPLEVNTKNASSQYSKSPASETRKDSYSHNSHKGSINNEFTRDKIDQSGLSSAQQQFILKFCRQLSSVIQACDQSESAEIEVGRRLIGKQQIKVKLNASREG